MAGTPGGGFVGRSINFLIQFITTGYAQAAQHINTMAETSKRASVQMDKMGHQTRTLTFEVVRWAIAWQLVYRTLNLVTGGIRDIFTSTIALDRELRNMNTIAQLSEAQFEKTRQQVIGLSTSFEGGYRPAVELAKALYDINSAGILGADAMKVLEASGRSAMAGLTDASTAAKAIITVLNAFGLGAQDAGKAAEVLFKTVQIGVPRFEDLAKNISVVAPTAAALGISMDEMGLALATLSRHIPDASLNQIALNQAMLAFLRPSDAMREAVKMTGEATGATLIQHKGFLGALREIYKVAGEDAAVWGQLAENRRALTAVLSLLQGNFKSLDEAIRQSGKMAEDALGAAQQEQAESYANQIRRLASEWEAVKLQLGEIAVPILGDMTAGIAAVIKEMRSGRIAALQFGAALLTVINPPAGRIAELALEGPARAEVERRSIGRAREAEQTRWGRLLAERTAGLSVRAAQDIRPGRMPGAAPDFTELMRQFENAQTAAGGVRDRFNEIQTILTQLEPAALQGLILSTKRLLELTGGRLDRARELAKINKDVALELRTHDELEQNLAKLEGRRVQIAQDLVREARQLGEAYQDALNNLVRLNLEEADLRLENLQRALQMQMDPLEKFREAMGDALDPKRAEALRKKFQELSLAGINAEIADLQHRLEWVDERGQKVIQGMERVQVAGRLADALRRRAGMRAGFYIEDVQVEQREFDARQKERDERRARLQAMLVEGGARAAWARGQLQAPDITPGRPEITLEKVQSFYDKESEAVNKLFTDTILPNIQKAEDAARAIAAAARRALIEFGEDFAKIDWKAMGERAGNLWREGFYKNGTLPPGFQKERDDARRGELGVLKRPGGGSSTELSITIQDPRLGGGTPTNIPLLVKGQVGIENLLRGSQPTREQVGIAIERAVERVAQGAILIFFKTLQDAIRAAQTRPVEEKVPISGLGSAALRGAIIIQIGTANLTGLSDRTKQELVAAVMAIPGDQAVQAERRRGTATQVA